MIQKLIDAILAKDAPVVVGLDPNLSFIPGSILENARAEAEGDCREIPEYFEKEFMASIEKFGIEMDYRYQAEMYRSGKYTEYVLHAIRHRAIVACRAIRFYTRRRFV